MALISDATIVADLAAEWNGVVVLRGKIQTNLLFAFAMGGIVGTATSDAAYNLPMIHAFGVLNKVLEAIRDEGIFRQRGNQLGALASASKGVIHWLDFPAVEKAINRRNEVAHHGEILPRGECWLYLDLIEVQLKAWGLIV